MIISEEWDKVGSGTLNYDGYEAYIPSGSTRYPSYTISGDHDAIQIIITGVTTNSFTPVHNGITYNWRLNISGSSSGNGASVVIPNVKDGDVITFTNNSSGGVQGVGFFGLSYQ